MIKWMIKFLQKRGYMVLITTAKKNKFVDIDGQMYAVFKK